VQLVLEDSAAGLLSRAKDESLEQLLEERGVEAVLYAGWEAIDLSERTAGEPHGRPRIKLASWDELLAAARAGLAPRG
jgi:ferredoxin--NADP+ reductase